jgi:hypothetical protein
MEIKLLVWIAAALMILLFVVIAPIAWCVKASTRKTFEIIDGDEEELSQYACCNRTEPCC